MAFVSELSCRWILDSRGFPTLYTEITFDQNGKKGFGYASVPSGASTGTHEALELRDGGDKFGGKGVETAVSNVLYKIGEKILSREFVSAFELDKFILSLDPTENKSFIGANSILSISMAAHRAFANLYNLELWQYLRRLYFSNLPNSPKFPRLMCNVINGGQHADNSLDIQEFMIVPNSGNIEDDIRMASEIYHTLKNNLHKDKLATSLGDEGGFAPNLAGTEQVLDYLQKAIVNSNYSNINCDLALDAAASEFYDKQKNIYKLENKEMSQSNLADFYKNLVERYNLISIEDGFAEDDILGWEIMTQSLTKKITLVGDDLFVTNPKRFSQIGLKNNLANSVLIKLNQIGSVLETCQMINLAKENDYSTIVSHRSGETIDDFIADLAFASQSEFIKLGAPARGERVAKYNRLLKIADFLVE
jgi:enolase